MVNKAVSHYFLTDTECKALDHLTHEEDVVSKISSGVEMQIKAKAIIVMVLLD